MKLNTAASPFIFSVFVFFSYLASWHLSLYLASWYLPWYLASLYFSLYLAPLSPFGQNHKLHVFCFSVPLSKQKMLNYKCCKSSVEKEHEVAFHQNFNMTDDFA